jgi:predicted dehydrogenase
MAHTLKNRRAFIQKSAVGSAALFAGGILPGFSSKSYGRIRGANDRIVVSLMGVNSRGTALGKTFATQENCEVAHVCDVDSRAIDRCIGALGSLQDPKPAGFTDFRESLEAKEVDALVIAAPDHWHAPAALLAMQAGKHVYIEKPCSHNPREGEMLIEAAKKYGKVVQMGNQRRSWPNVMEAIRELKGGAIGRAYFGKSWYSNNRGPIGKGKVTEVPEWLNWELWQGPAPRTAYRDNIVHYNWHWFWHWGTGEALNNGTHMIDLLRWGFEVDYPVRVSSNGGRYRYDDDWETPDTQVINLDFDGGISMTWEGRSCNGKHIEGASVGAMFYGENGSLLITGGNSYRIFDLDNKIVKEVNDDQKIDPRDAANPAGHLDAKHVRNFFDAILNRGRLNADIDSGHKSTLLVQLGNISQRVGRSLNIDKTTGRILNDKKARQLWSRTYEKGWEMAL